MERMAICGFCLAMLLGCGKAEDPWGSVSGTVSQEGRPVSGAAVLFSNREIGVETTAVTNGNGQFTMRTARVPGLTVASYKVAVVKPPANRPPPVNIIEFRGPPPNAEASSIPERYGKLETSQLSASVQQGENHFDLKLSAH